MNPGIRTKNRSAQTDGFTLLEVMVAVTVLGIALTALLYGQAQSIRAQARTQNVTLATLLAMEMITDRALIHRDTLPRSGETEEVEFEPPYNDLFRGAIRVEDDEMMPEMIQKVYFIVTWEADQERLTEEFLSNKESGGGNRLEICLQVANMQIL